MRKTDWNSIMVSPVKFSGIPFTGEIRGWSKGLVEFNASSMLQGLVANKG